MGLLIGGLAAHRAWGIQKIETDPDSIDPSLAPAERQVSARDFSGAELLLRTYLRDHPKSSRAHYDLGYVLFRDHKIGESIQELSKSLQLNVNSAEAHKILGLDCTIVGRYDLAEAELQEAERLDPESAEIHYFLGRAYYTREVYPLAKNEFEAALRTDPNYMKAYSNLGLTMEVLGNDEEALKDYTTAARLDEQQNLRSEWPYVYLSAFYNRKQDPDTALGFAQKALTINPRSDVAYFQSAKAYRARSEWQKTADAARNAIAIDGRTPDFYYLLSVALRKLGQSRESDDALATFERLQQKAHHPLGDRAPQEPLVAPDPR